VRERLVLAIETATADMAVALADGAGLLAEVTVCRGRRHAETLHPSVEHLLALAEVDIAEIALVAVDIGPGLFTGLRVGVAAAKAFAAGLGLPLVCATSLELLAAAARPLAGGDVEVVPVVDMRRGEIAWHFEGEPGPELGAPGPLGRRLVERAGERRLLLVGDGAARHGELIAAAAGAGPSLSFAGSALTAPPARVLATLALERFAAGELADPVSLVPLYLRAADAVINWETRHGREVRA
jgi:tRNA threonylcarbamoyladenosine biosynthesis protein TsaB